MDSNQDNQVFSNQQIKSFLANNDYEYLKVLGQGDYSIVVQAYSHQLQINVAVKIFKQIQQDFELEMQILEKMKGERYVLQIISSISDPNSNMNAIVTELYDCNLNTILSCNKFTYQQVLVLAFQLLEALLVLQKNGVLHSDIKPHNILYSCSKNEFILCDFGKAYAMKKPSWQQTNQSLDGNYFYMSPEVTNQEKPYTIKVDTFSIGIVILQALLGDTVKPLQYISLKVNLIENVIPNIKNHKNYDFIQNILSQMTHFEQQNRLEPLKLIQNLKSYKIEQNCLKQLQFSQKLNSSIPNFQQNVVQNSKTQQINKEVVQIPQQIQKDAQDQHSYKCNQNSAELIVHNLIEHTTLTPENFDPLFNRDWSNQAQGKISYRGGILIKNKGFQKQHYIIPAGWKGFGLNINKYKDKEWIGHVYGIPTYNSTDQWIVLYHGTSIQGLQGIVKDGFKVGLYHKYAGSKCRITGQTITKSSQCVYLTDDVNSAGNYSTPIDIKGQVYKIVLQCRVHPKVVRSPKDKPDFYLVEESDQPSKTIRPYRILLQQLSDEDRNLFLEQQKQIQIKQFIQEYIKAESQKQKFLTENEQEFGCVQDITYQGVSSDESEDEDNFDMRLIDQQLHITFEK